VLLVNDTIPSANVGDRTPKCIFTPSIKEHWRIGLWRAWRIIGCFSTRNSRKRYIACLWWQTNRQRRLDRDEKCKALFFGFQCRVSCVVVSFSSRFSFQDIKISFFLSRICFLFFGEQEKNKQNVGVGLGLDPNRRIV